MTTVPAWYPDPTELKPAPMPLLLVQAFLNTCELDTQTDLLDDAAAAENWFVTAGLLAAGSSARRLDVARARAVRESIRAILASAGSEPVSQAVLDPLRNLAQTRQPRLAIDDRGRLGLENETRGGLADGLFELLLIIRAAQENGTWTRLKVCANPDCRWVYYDRSRNQQGHWCDMAVCGNRLKNRRLRARRR
jgi:predicted RNA-binding Zn ribbon-like protein